jgi:hypothetical protein
VGELTKTLPCPAELVSSIADAMFRQGPQVSARATWFSRIFGQDWQVMYERERRADLTNENDDDSDKEKT